ncbi:MAG: hypothetical protein ACRDJG_08430 [Actinomycetota bacterium]
MRLPPPPRIVRRLVLAPLALALSLGLIVASPVLVVTAAIVDLVAGGQGRSVRLTAFAVAYLGFEVIGLLAMFGLWVVGAAGLRLRTPRMQDAHYRFFRWWLRGIHRSGAGLFRLRIRIEDQPPPQQGPVLVFSRHAGPGNSLMLLGTLMIDYRRRPRVVALDKLQWEPLFDILGNRLPNRFIRHDPSRREHYVQAIGELAAGIGTRDAFVLFPEGHDFTHRLRRRAIAHLRKRGHQNEAEKAERMPHVLPPRHGGVMAAVTSAPDADVVFVAHTVLENLGSLKQFWDRIPLDGPVFARYWRIPADEVPRQREELIEWLFSWWATIDRWIERTRSRPRADAAERRRR